MATYKQIQEYVKQKHGYIPKTCWIAHMKELSGLHPKMSPRRYSPNARVQPCPIEKQDDIKESFQYFKMI
ncbi:hypothetical protein [Paenibacillus sp.]|uniref:hypothetical protein n=1 Tax=Paenibacillus sp. TaxID=58172 RepID=UPI0028AB9D48|nr:hypothetical protein [Paenibacillus sp.]